MEQLRDLGLSVAVTSACGDGFPDIVVGVPANPLPALERVRGFAEPANYLLEIKDPAQEPARRRLTPAQQRFHDAWQGPCYTIETVDDALAAMGLRRADGAPGPVSGE